MHYFQFNIGDYARSTLHLSLMEDLAYRRLLDMYYDTEAPIPLETHWVARRIRMETEIVESVLNDMFKRTDEGFRHPRCDVEIAEYQALRERNRANGKRGGRPKTVQNQQPENPLGSQSQPSGNPKHKPETINHKPIPPYNPPKGESVSLPDWLPMDAWEGWLEMRAKRKKPLTARATTRAINKLEAMRQAGTNIAEVLDRSTMNGWTDLYEIKEQNNGRSKAKDGVSAALDDMLGLGEPSRAPERRDDGSIEGTSQRPLASPSTMR